MSERPNLPHVYTEAEARSATEVLKSSVPELWDKYVAIEKKEYVPTSDEYVVLRVDLIHVLKSNGYISSLSEGSSLLFAIRRLLRIDLGLPV